MILNTLSFTDEKDEKKVNGEGFSKKYNLKRTTVSKQGCLDYVQYSHYSKMNIVIPIKNDNDMLVITKMAKMFNNMFGKSSVKIKEFSEKFIFKKFKSYHKEQVIDNFQSILGFFEKSEYDLLNYVELINDKKIKDNDNFIIRRLNSNFPVYLYLDGGTSSNKSKKLEKLIKKNQTLVDGFKFKNSILISLSNRNSYKVQIMIQFFRFITSMNLTVDTNDTDVNKDDKINAANIYNIFKNSSDNMNFKFFVKTVSSLDYLLLHNYARIGNWTRFNINNKQINLHMIKNKVKFNKFLKKIFEEEELSLFNVISENKHTIDFKKIF